MKTVMDALLATKGADIPGIVKQLNSDQIDTLMKYVYRGMAVPEQYSSASLLQWHEKV
jgi:actin related protein 2/3 complex subunit 5